MLTRREIQAHAGYNLLIDKLYDTHDGLRACTPAIARIAQLAVMAMRARPRNGAGGFGSSAAQLRSFWGARVGSPTFTELRSVDQAWEAVTSCPLGPSWMETLVGNHDKVQQTVEIHHKVEDDVIYPYLHRRFGFDPSPLFAEHDRLVATMQAFRDGLRALVSVPSESRLAEFADEARAVQEGLDRHLDNEEETAFVAMLKLGRDDLRAMFGDRFC